MNAFSEFVVKSVYSHQKFAVKNVDQIPKFIAFFAIRYILAPPISYCKYSIPPNRNGKATEMERKQTAEAADYRGRTASRENLADEGIREALLYRYRIYQLRFQFQNG